MALKVTRIRTVESGRIDRWGKPIFDRVETTHTAHGFAPLVAGDVMGVDSVVSTDGGTLYFRIPHVTDAQPADKFIVRGTEYECEGRDALWANPNGTIKGCVITLKREVFTDG